MTGVATVRAMACGDASNGSRLVVVAGVSGRRDSGSSLVFHPYNS